MLTEVRVYRGQPGTKSHPNLVSAFTNQVSTWRAIPRVEVITRPLRYEPVAWTNGRPSRWRAEEKGIDVLIALDLALGARDDRFDVAVLFSSDTDLVPAIERCLDAGRRVETATWTGPNASAAPLNRRLGNVRIWNHDLGRSEFDLVADATDYRRR